MQRESDGVVMGGGWDVPLLYVTALCVLFVQMYSVGEAFPECRVADACHCCFVSVLLGRVMSSSLLA